eukprot:TRINITY_DN795_c0_g1_i2.p1 TRINITY_DN795_c0_g1~~TRINITY_DN795_c0_g1_i2.p1  ORF type:complete len:147 (+),score=7.95 TRINITY_DN795_c0_g1_i2:442-882(+)
MRDARLVDLVRGIPFSLLLSNDHGEIQILVANQPFYQRQCAAQPFNRELIPSFALGSQFVGCEALYFLYQVHVSLSFVVPPTLAASIYLSALRFYHQDYDVAFRLMDSFSSGIIQKISHACCRISLMYPRGTSIGVGLSAAESLHE